MKKKLVFLGLICLSLFAFVGCGAEKLDISNCIDVRYGEFNGSAKIYESSLNLGKLQDIPKLKGLTPDMLKGDYKITLVGDKTDLKNGDKVKLHLEYNKELYKRDFNVEFKFEPTEVTIEGLPDKLTDINQISKEKWDKIYAEVNKKAEIKAKDNKYSDLKLEQVLAYKTEENITTNNIEIEFLYSYFNTNKEKRYLSFYGYLSFKENNILNPIEIKESTKWEKVSNQDYNKSIDEIFKIYFKKSNFKILWNSKN
ncbi:TcpJ [Clostridium perfringens]|uniref:TcpJ n=2 Tax=Clostridium perfringens TaxID=1502 RepID=UPI0024BCBB73|nr:TcpJ [Clostridium perfringens]